MKKNKNKDKKLDENKKENIDLNKKEEIKQEDKKIEDANQGKESKEVKQNEDVKQEKLNKKEKKQKEKKEKSNVKLTEKISLNLRRKWLVNSSRTFFLVAILLLAYITLNLIIGMLELPELDVTKSRVYSLSEDSKKAIEKVNQDVKIYVYGYEEDSQLIKFLEKYHKANERITYEILTEETNYEKIKENELQEGYYILIFESGDAKKVVDASTEFVTVDYTTYQQVDTTEQSITNAILSLMVENKPKIYFTSGHQEYALSSELPVLETYLKNESFEVETINLATVEAVPEDCSVLAIMSPTVDLYDNERDVILNYISKGGKIYFSIDPLPTAIELPNIQTILSQFGATFENGQIIELGTNSAVPSSPNVFKPQLSTISDITGDIYSSNGAVWIAYSGRVNIESKEALTEKNVERLDLLSSSQQSIFVTDLSANIETAMQNATPGVSVVASLLTKTISTEETENAEPVQAKLIISANGSYISNYQVAALSANYPLSYIANNKDFAINCMAHLADKEGLTIRKELTAQATYVPTETEKIVVVVIIFSVPALIILAGFAVWAYRKKRK